MKLGNQRLCPFDRGAHAILGLASLLCALSAFSQVGGGSVDQPADIVVVPVQSTSQKQIFGPPPLVQPGKDSVLEPVKPTTTSTPPDFNRNIYFRNKLEFSLDAGWLPINIPFPLDIFVGDAYNTYPLKYTLVPVIASLRWHLNDVGGPWIFRGNWDLSASASVTAIPRGPETRYFSYMMGIRRNFVRRNWRAVPYFDVRLGLGNIDAKGPEGVPYAQGEDLTFTVNMGSGIRYSLNARYGISAGLNFMHISNLDLSQGNGKPDWGIRNYGINVYGPMLGIDMQLGRHPRNREK